MKTYRLNTHTKATLHEPYPQQNLEKECKMKILEIKNQYKFNKNDAIAVCTGSCCNHN